LFFSLFDFIFILIDDPIFVLKEENITFLKIKENKR